MQKGFRVVGAAAPPRGEWSVEQCARFAARRDFHLIKALVNDLPTLEKARGHGLLPKPPGGVEGTHKEEPGGSDASSGATQARRCNRRPRRKTEARKAKEQQQFEQKQERKRAAASRADAVHAADAAAPTPSPEAEVHGTEQRAAAEAAPAAAEPGTTAAMVPAAVGTEAAPAMQIGGREKRGASSVGFTTPEKEKGGDEGKQQGAVGRGGSGGGSGRDRKKRLTFKRDEQQGDEEPTEEQGNAIKYADTRARIAAMPPAEAANRQHHAMMVMDAIEAAGYRAYLDEEKLMCDLCFRPGFERGVMTVDDWEFLGISAEQALGIIEVQKQERTRQAGDAGADNSSRVPEASDHRGLLSRAAERVAGWARSGSE